jgi:hypothetical protein
MKKNSLANLSGYFFYMTSLSALPYAPEIDFWNINTLQCPALIKRFTLAENFKILSNE